MAPVLSKLAEHRKLLISAVTGVGGVCLYLLARGSYAYRSDQDVVLSSKDHKGKKSKAAVDLTFFRRLGTLLKIVIPGPFSMEVVYIMLVAVLLLLRTYYDIWVIKNTTSIESSIIGRDMSLFKKHLLDYIITIPLLSTINNLLKYGLHELSLRFRTRLSTHLYHQYMHGFTFYKMSNLDNRIANADQLLTQDIDRFSETLTDLYSNIAKPILDIVLYIRTLAGNIGPQGPLSMLGYLAVSGFVLTKLRSPVGGMTMREQQLEGTLRFVNSRVITSSEEISFYQGSVREEQNIRKMFGRLVDHLRSIIHFRFGMGFIDSMVANYMAAVVGYLAISRPFLDLSHPRHRNSTHKELLTDYYQNGWMLVQMADAIGRLVLAGRDFARLSGFTARVFELIEVLRDLHNGVYERTMVATEATEDDRTPLLPLIPGSGELVEANYVIRFEQVPLVTPNGDVLIRDLSFEVKSGMNVLVCGPNGCGKSSLFRILGELWPLFGGRLVKPHRSKLFYIPQRPYMTLGTLRDQVIYPDTEDDQYSKGITDEQLEEYLKQVRLHYLLEREGGWDVIQDWMDVLSGGEKQRIAMARLFYNEPQFAILDECTSAVSADVEDFLYTHCREKGITLFTVSHRKCLWKHHEYVLQFDGEGSYEFKQIDFSAEDFGS